MVRLSFTREFQVFQSRSSPVATGGFGGLSHPKQSSNPPQIEMQNCKSPLLKTFWRRLRVQALCVDPLTSPDASRAQCRIARLVFSRPNFRNLPLFQVGLPRKFHLAFFWPRLKLVSLKDSIAVLAFLDFLRWKNFLCRNIFTILCFRATHLRKFCDKCYFKPTLAVSKIWGDSK